MYKFSLLAVLVVMMMMVVAGVKHTEHYAMFATCISPLPIFRSRHKNEFSPGDCLNLSCLRIWQPLLQCRGSIQDET